ncbi:MAG: alpha-ribazole phosphatase family protein [Gammaproteobacteria bacterium]|nr:alpha-ribazole phosphatase family protein [Gammaproteobacteria bacterium]
MDVYLIRHTRPDLGPDICYGSLDVALAPDFEIVAERVAAALPRAVPVMTTQARRCRPLAELVAGRLGSRLIVDDRLRELDFGRWEGVAWCDIPRAQTDAWTRDVWNRSAPGGESYAAMHGRVLAAWEAMLAGSYDALALIGHAGPLRALITIALELPAETFVRFQLGYGGMTKISDATGGWRLEYSNTYPAAVP